MRNELRTTHISLKSVLTRLGMGLAFSPAADFTSLSPQGCCIGLVEQAATLDIGEKGTVASAATAVGVQATAGHVLPPPVVFNRPYLLVVTDRGTGEPCSWPGSPTPRGAPERGPGSQGTAILP